MQGANYHLHEICLYGKLALKYHKTAPFFYFTPNEDLWLKPQMIYIRVEQEQKRRWRFKSFDALLLCGHVEVLNNHVQMITYQNLKAQQ